MKSRVVVSAVVVGLVCLAFAVTGAQSSQGSGESLRELAAAREELAQRALEKIELWWSTSGRKIDEVELLDWMRRLMDAQYDLAETDGQRTAAIQAHVDRLVSRLEKLRALERAGRLDSTNDPELVEYYLLEAKELLIRSHTKAE